MFWSTVLALSRIYHRVTGTTGKNLSTSHRGCTYGFVMRFIDAEHLKAYAPHPAHQVVSKELRDICQSIIDFDIE